MLATDLIRGLTLLPLALCFPLDLSPRQNNDSDSEPPARLIVFGDSYSDDGNGSWIVSNETWPSDPAYYGHHFSNGPVWAQDMAANLSLELLDYGYGGATADNDFVPGVTGYYANISVPSTNEQIATFLQNDSFLPTDIVTIYIGANDPTYNSSITAAEVAGLIASQVFTLWNASVQTVLLASYPFLNTWPAEVSSNISTQDYLQTYTTSLTIGLETIANAWSPYMNIAVADIHGLFDELYADPEAFGINASYVNPSVGCLVGAYPDEGPRTLCDDPKTHVFFDTYHPTKEVHQLMSERFQIALAEALG